MTHSKTLLSASLAASLLVTLALPRISTGLLLGSFHEELLLGQWSPPIDLENLRALEQTVIISHVVEPHEDLWAIHKRYGVDIFTIKSSNDLDNQFPPAGSLLRFPNHAGTLYQVKTPESLHAVSQNFSIGKRLGVKYEAQVLAMNGYPTLDLASKDFSFPVGTILFLPEAWKPTGLPFPFVSDGHRLRITSRFGMRTHPILGGTRHHSGFDIAKPYGTPVLASREGTVVSAGWAGGYGNMIELRHTIKNQSGTKVFCTRYGHLSKVLVNPGQHVHMYQMIGRVGSTGLSTGPHLHFEVRNGDGEAINPGQFQ